MNFLTRAKTTKQDFTEESERIKKINDTWYAIGDCVNDMCNLRHHMFLNSTKGLYSLEIDPSTLAISFNKEDKEDKKVFFSLSSNGRGGDIVEYSERKDRYIAMRYALSDKLIFMPVEDDFEIMNTMANVKIIGIQE